MVMAYPSSFVFKDHHVPAAFVPSAHIFYGERILDLDDDIPKWAGHKNMSEQLPHAPKESRDRTMAKGQRHKAGGGVEFDSRGVGNNGHLADREILTARAEVDTLAPKVAACLPLSSKGEPIASDVVYASQVKWDG